MHRYKIVCKLKIIYKQKCVHKYDFKAMHAQIQITIHSEYTSKQNLYDLSFKQSIIGSQISFFSKHMHKIIPFYYTLRKGPHHCIILKRRAESLYNPQEYNQIIIQSPIEWPNHCIIPQEKDQIII